MVFLVPPLMVQVNLDEIVIFITLLVCHISHKVSVNIIELIMTTQR